MVKPILLTVDDDPNVLRAVERDLRRQYGERFRVLRADSGASALETLRQLKERGEAAALFLVDQRMPAMTGVEFLEAAIELYPLAKRVLLTAYADTDAAIRAINGARIDYYLMKPWDPPEELLYPTLDDLLENWGEAHRPSFEGIRVLGDRWSPQSHEIKNFLGRHQVPFQWIDVALSDGDDQARRLLQESRPSTRDGTPDADDSLALPLVFFPDGARLSRPTISEVADKIGLQTRADKPFYDLVVVGAGPAGLAAAVYGASEGLSTLMVEKEAPGGQAGTSSRIENYLGFPIGLSGADLARRAIAQARRFGVEIISPQEVKSLRAEGQYRIVTLGDGREVSCRALLLSMGVQWNALDIPGIEKFTGAGVYYGAAATEALSCANEVVYIVGGANSAGQAAMHFSRYAARVVMLVRGPDLSRGMSDYLVDQIAATPNIEVRFNTSVTEACGDKSLEAITITNVQTGQTKRVPATSLFIFIGAIPRTEWLRGVIETDGRGFLLSGSDLVRDGERPAGWKLNRDPALLETNLAGVFVAGDVRAGSIKRVASSVGEGSVCVSLIHQYLREVAA
jgi:thioredoxin reductase (NADPH)